VVEHRERGAGGEINSAATAVLEYEFLCLE
jgi:hypothetical protein